MGAGIYQVPLIQTAKRMGLETVVVSTPGNYPGFAVADFISYTDTRDTAAVLQVAKEYQIAGICTAGTDVAVYTIGVVCDALGLSGISAKAAELCTDKSKMKEAFIQNGVRTAAFARVSTLLQCREVFDRLRRPVIFKAVDSSGSRGIIKVEDKASIQSAWEKVFSVTKLDYFIIEEFLQGFEFGAQAFVYNGEIKLFLPHGDMVSTYGDTGVPVGHYAPIEVSSSLLEDCREQTIKSIQALGLNDCAVNVDCICQDEKVYVLEVGARVGATCLPELVSLYYGMDYYEKIIMAALGEEPVFPEPVCQPNASLLITSSGDGVFQGAQMGEACQDTHVMKISLDVKPGDKVRVFRVGPDRIGEIIVTGDTTKDAIERVYQIQKAVKIQVD